MYKFKKIFRRPEIEVRLRKEKKNAFGIFLVPGSSSFELLCTKELEFFNFKISEEKF